MYNFLTEAVKRRFLLELRAYWASQPKYRDIVDNIQGKYSFKERPSYGIILKTSSANHVQLSADNFLGYNESYVQLAKFQGKPGTAIEWVKEDLVAVQNNGGIVPSSPGIYYIQIVEGPPKDHGEPSFAFMVDPLLDVQDERPTQIDAFTWSVSHPYLNGTTRVFEMPGQIPYIRNSNYTEEPDTGRIRLVNPVPTGTYLLVSYRYPAESTGPWPIVENFSNKRAIPGVSLAFGRGSQLGDIMAVVVTRYREITAMEYGGRWETSLDFDVVARDPYAQQEISDRTVMFLWGIARNRLSSEGIEILSVSMGGETEEAADENGDDYYYNSSFSLNVQTDWSIQVPLVATIRRVVPLTLEQSAEIAGSTSEEMLEAGVQNNITVLEQMGLESLGDPYFGGRTATFEMIR